MSRSPSTSSVAGLNTRVTVIEGSVERLENAVESGRVESRQAAQSINTTLERLVTQDARREGATPNKTNWYAFASMGAAVFAIVAAIFSLAEWRVGTATAPIIEKAMAQERTIRDLNEKALNLRVDLEKERAIRDYIERLTSRSATATNRN